MSLNWLVHTAIRSARADRERFFGPPSGSSCFECTERKTALNLHGFEPHRPSSKGTKLLLQVIKASINQFTNVHSLILQKYVTEEVRNLFTYCTLRCVLVNSRALRCATHTTAYSAIGQVDLPRRDPNSETQTTQCNKT